jgi:hypothetical protein
MNMGDTATFDVRTSFPVLSPTRVRGNAAPSLINSTRISGFLINQGSSVGSFAQPFLAINETDFSHASPAYLGETVVLTEIFDVGNNFFPGDGAGNRAVFTAPETGIYHLEYCGVADVPFQGFWDASIITTQKAYTTRSERMFDSATGHGTEYITISVDTAMNLGDTATFQARPSNLAGSVNILGNGSPFDPTGRYVNSTRVCGHRIA